MHVFIWTDRQGDWSEAGTTLGYLLALGSLPPLKDCKTSIVHQQKNELIKLVIVHTM
jgi:hypothetical protein